MQTAKISWREKVKQKLRSRHESVSPAPSEVAVQAHKAVAPSVQAAGLSDGNKPVEAEQDPIPVRTSPDGILSTGNPDSVPFVANPDRKASTPEPDDTHKTRTGQTVALSAWQEAYKLLEPAERDIFLKACPGFHGELDSIRYEGSELSNQILSACEKARVLRDDHHPNWKKGFSTAIKILEFSKDIIADIASSNPYAAAACTATAVILPLLLIPAAESKEAADLLEEAIQLTAVYRWHETTYGHFDDLHETIRSLYLEIFQAEISLFLHFCDRSLASRIAHSFKDKGSWREKLDRLHKLDANCSRHIEVLREHARCEWRLQEDAHFSTVSKRLERILNEMKQDRMAEQLRRLDMNYRRARDQNPARVAGTCVWFLRHPRFLEWRTRQQSSLLWVSADPGCGKSVLSKFLLDCDASILSDGARPRSPTRLVCYFFFKDGLQDQMSAAKAVGAILHQLILQAPALICQVAELEKRNDTAIYDFDFLWHVFLRMMQDDELADTEVVCVLDALDECSGASREELISSLVEFFDRSHQSKLSPHSAAVKMIVTSRPYIEIEQDFTALVQETPEIRLHGEEESEIIEKEISLVIKHHVNEMGQMIGLTTPKALQKLEDALTGIQHKTYLWLHLVINYLQYSDAGLRRRRRFASDRELLEALRELPASVDMAYERLLERSTNESMARKLLNIVLSATRPLTVTEAFVALKTDNSKSSYDDIFDGFLQPSASELKNLCGLLLQVTDDRVYLLHQTVREYLIPRNPSSTVVNDVRTASREVSPLPLKWKHRFSVEESNFIMARICLRLLSFSEAADKYKDPKFSNRFLLSDAQSPLLKYAGREVAQHIRLAGHLIDEATWIIVCAELFAIGSTMWKASHVYTIDPTFDEEFKNAYLSHSWPETQLISASAYFYLARHGIVEGIRFCYDKGLPLRATLWTQLLPLAAAAEYGHEEVAIELLKRGKALKEVWLPQETAYWPLWNPLCRSIGSGHRAISDALLQHSSLWYHMPDEDYDCCLRAVAISWYYDDGDMCIEILEHQGKCTCDAEDLDRVRESSYFRRKSMSEHHPPGSGYRGQPGPGEGDDENSRSIVSALFEAISRSYTKVTMALLTNTNVRIDEDTTSYGMTLLSYACSIHTPNLDMIRILIKHGASVNCHLNTADWPLIYAVKNESVDVVRLLIEHGASVNLERQDVLHGTALAEAASSQSHDEEVTLKIMRLLLHAGADVNQQSGRVGSALKSAIFNNNLPALRLLISQGAIVDLDDAGDYGTALQMAISMQKLEAARVLLEHDANPLLTRLGLDVPIQSASWHGNLNIVRELLHRGARVDTASGTHGCVLHAAALGGEPEIVQLLIEHGASPNAEGGKYGYALQAAACHPFPKQSLEIVRILLQAGANINAQGGVYGTALKAACRANHPETVKYLFRRGADPSIEGACRLTALGLTSLADIYSRIRPDDMPKFERLIPAVEPSNDDAPEAVASESLRTDDANLADASPEPSARARCRRLLLRHGVKDERVTDQEISSDHHSLCVVPTDMSDSWLDDITTDFKLSTDVCSILAFGSISAVPLERPRLRFK